MQLGVSTTTYKDEPFLFYCMFFLDVLDVLHDPYDTDAVFNVGDGQVSQPSSPPETSTYALQQCTKGKCVKDDARSTMLVLLVVSSIDHRLLHRFGLH